MQGILKYIYPKIEFGEAIQVLKFAFIGAFIAGLYGVLHDQVTYTISPEYFTKLKFAQFQYANVGISDRFFVGTIGFLATWWVGLFIGWFLGRRYVPKLSFNCAKRSILTGYMIVFVAAIVSAIGGWAYGLFANHNEMLSDWYYTLDYYGISNGVDFVRVAYIHNFSYAGGLIGLLITFLLIKPKVHHGPVI